MKSKAAVLQRESRWSHEFVEEGSSSSALENGNARGVGSVESLVCSWKRWCAVLLVLNEEPVMKRRRERGARGVTPDHENPKKILITTLYLFWLCKERTLRPRMA